MRISRGLSEGRHPSGPYSRSAGTVRVIRVIREIPLPAVGRVRPSRPLLTGGEMATLLDNLETRPAESWNRPVTTGAAERLRTTMAACRVQFTWWGVQRALTADQKAQAAQAFDAEGEFLSAGKKLLDTKHTAFRAVTAIRTKIGDYWKGLSLPFPEPGIRLIKLEAVEDFDRQMADYKAELDDAVANLDRHFDELKQAAARRLGSLFNPSDYPETLRGLFGVSFDFPSVEPPDYLVQLAPDLYQREQERVRARFEEAVRLAEQAFLEEFAAAGQPPDRADHRHERGRQPEGLPRLGRRQPLGLLRAVPLAERPQQPAARRARRPGPAGRAERRRPGPAGQRGHCAARWPRSSRGSRRRWTPCSWTGRGGGSSATPRHRGPSHEARWSSPTGRSGRSTTRRSTSACSAVPRSPAPATSSPIRRAAGWPTCRRWAARCSGRSTAAARPWRPRRDWLERHWLTRTD